MTREELIDGLYDVKNWHCNGDERLHTLVTEAIKVLEQEPVLEKIRAEIEPKCDRINSLASVLPYTAHREIQELLCEIMDLFEPEESEG